jgi:hypothetical protein
MHPHGRKRESESREREDKEVKVVPVLNYAMKEYV